MSKINNVQESSPITINSENKVPWAGEEQGKEKEEEEGATLRTFGMGQQLSSSRMPEDRMDESMKSYLAQSPRRIDDEVH